MSADDSNRSDDDVFNILVATDIHLGYGESDPIRDSDTFVTLEEILQIAQREEVDFLLLGGDLFHETRPSPYCIFKCTQLFRKYCLGDRPVQIEFLSDQSNIFAASLTDTVNYEDPNLNVSIPVFSIHGNHDDPTGEKQISAMDLMAQTGLLNYFGKIKSFDNVAIEPILLKKGESQLALYGLSHIRDERLGRLFLDNKVTMLSPEEVDDWFHLLVWHQNRASRGTKNFIPDETLPDFLDLVIWGHEHDCRIEPEPKLNGVYISQPGSTVATSLANGESIPKCVGLLKVHKKQFNMKPIELKTVRPFVFRDMVLDELEVEVASSDKKAVEKIAQEAFEKVAEKIAEMIEIANKMERTKQLPLIRLNVKYTNENQVFNAIRAGQKYIGKVANPEDMIKMQPYKVTVRSRKKAGDGFATDQDEDEEEKEYQIQDIAGMLDDILLNELTGKQELVALSGKGMNETLKKIMLGDTEAFKYYVNKYSLKLLNELDENGPKDGATDEKTTDEYIKQWRQEREGMYNFIEEANEILNDPSRKNVRKKASVASNDDEMDSTLDDDDSDDIYGNSSKANGKPARGKGSKGGKGSRGPRGGRGRGRAAKV